MYRKKSSHKMTSIKASIQKHPFNTYKESTISQNFSHKTSYYTIKNPKTNKQVVSKHNSVVLKEKSVDSAYQLKHTNNQSKVDLNNSLTYSN
jgi:hypothetical protein